jgi:magnesium transporter
MTFYRIADKTVVESEVIPSKIDGLEFFVICRANEVPALLDIFKWDESALLECSNLDETVRHTSYSNYDFTSLIYVEAENGSVRQNEINLFFSKQYLVLIIPNIEGKRLSRLVSEFRKMAMNAAIRTSPLIYLYYLIFNGIVADFSENLEILEDEVEALADMIVERPHQEHLSRIGRLRKTAYIYKKMLRALSYIGEQILTDENQLLNDDHLHYFRNINARLMKQYDFAESLYELSNDMLHTYDSKFSAQTNTTMNKLAAITLIFGSLTVITGVYGMNFDNMPELNWALGYPFALSVMATVALTIFLIMKKKKWL